MRGLFAEFITLNEAVGGVPEDNVLVTEGNQIDWDETDPAGQHNDHLSTQARACLLQRPAHVRMFPALAWSMNLRRSAPGCCKRIVAAQGKIAQLVRNSQA